MRFFSLQFSPYGVNLQVIQKVAASLKFRAFPAIKSSKKLLLRTGFCGPVGLDDGMIRFTLSCIAMLLITIGGRTSRSQNRFYPTATRRCLAWAHS